MSVNTTNIVQIRGRPATIRSIRNLVRTRASNFDFNRIVPMPFEVSNAGAYVANAWMETHWKARWIGLFEAVVKSAPTEYTVSFLTSYGDANKVLLALSKRYRSARITNLYASEDIGSECGVAVFRDGYEDFQAEPDLRGNAVFAEAVVSRRAAKLLDDPGWQEAFRAGNDVVYRISSYDVAKPDEEDDQPWLKRRRVAVADTLYATPDAAVRAYQEMSKNYRGRLAKGGDAPVVNDTVSPTVVHGRFSTVIGGRVRFVEITTEPIVGGEDKCRK